MKNNKKTKKKIIIVCTAICLLAALSVINFTSFPISCNFTLTSFSSQPQMYIAHRGYSSAYPENTLPAIQAAVDNGFYGCEFDIHTTKDGVWIINHNDTVDKMSNGIGEISKLTYKEIQEFSIDNGNGIKNYSDLKFPTLEEALVIISKSNTVPFIEIKGYDTVAFQKLLDEIEKYNLLSKAVIISFDMDALIGVRTLNSDIKLMYLTNRLTKEDVDICKENGNIGVDINSRNIFKMSKEIEYAKELGLETAAWTVDIPILADILNMFGIKYITTNRITPKQ